MINLKKHDNVADAVKDILQQEALKGNQGAIDANHNGEVDAQDFKILRAKKKKVEEETDVNDRSQDTLAGSVKTKHKDDVGPGSNGKSTKVRFHAGPKNEEVEQIDELSINTLTRVKHAATSAASDASREGDEGKSTKRYDLAGKASNKIETKNRALGLKPSGQHAFEEVEQIDELSKSTLGSYLDKKKSEYMKGKTQSGSKENAKDIQNMGKAHDKMTLKQMKESFEEPVLDELINEVMSKDASAGDWIHDFVHSDNPKFAGKSKAKRKEMALAAYYSKKNEEAVNEGLKDMAKKTFKALTGGSDKDHLDRLKKDMYGGSEVKYAAKTLVKHAKDPLGLKKEEVVEEGWDDMVKAAQEKVKSGPKPSGGSGKKEGSRYGGSKQKEKPEQEDVKEAKNPMMDAGVGAEPNFSTDAAKPMKVAQTMAKKSLAKMRSDMMGKSGK